MRQGPSRVIAINPLQIISNATPNNKNGIKCLRNKKRRLNLNALKIPATYNDNNTNNLVSQSWKNMLISRYNTARLIRFIILRLCRLYFN